VAGAVRVSVSDTGTGLTPDVVERMFQPFFTTKRQGLGMGLTINRDIVEAHQGRLWAENASGHRGAMLAFELPVSTSTATKAIGISKG
jgi:two-component system sensor kinase FixL